jgi:hypothetical protein
MDDFLVFADNRDVALHFRDRVASLLDRLGPRRNPKKRLSEPIQIYKHLSNITSTFRTPTSKLHTMATFSGTLLQRATRDAPWLPAQQLALLAGKAQYIRIAIPAARFYLRELHHVLSTRTGWGELVKLTYQLTRDM